MEFDLLVRKYLRGTLSPSELERLRDLLERVPEYRTELQQILELRSIIHDDALRLVPPRELSDRTRESVGAQFAGIESLLKHDASRLATPGDLSDATRMAVGQLFAGSAAAAPVAAPVVADEEAPKRRGVILPFRVAGRALLAASIAITVALAPTMLGPSLGTPDATSSGPLAARSSGASVGSSGDRAGRSAMGSSTAGDAMPGTSGLSAFGDGAETERAAADRVADGRGAGIDEITPLAAAGTTTRARGARRATGTTATVSSSIAAATLASASIASTTSGSGAVTTPSTDASDQPALAAVDLPIELDPDNPLSRLVPVPLALGGGRVYNPSIASAMRARLEPQPSIALATIGIPGVVDDGRHLSVGVTLGSGNVMDADAPTALMQNSYYFSFSVSDADRIGVEMGGSKFLQETQVPGKRPVGNIFAKQGAGDTTGGSSSLRTGDVDGTPTVAQRVKQDITYGGVFYDRRLEIESAWDLCGRVTFGAADGALVAGVRAYTAYSPTKNVTFTLGIGGSTLFDLKSRTDDGSTNYGLYYGIETGF